jgi:nucleoside-diphosphate-sugar epimerase
MMRIAVLGATSEIAKDLILSFAKNSTHSLALFARRPEAVRKWLTTAQVTHPYDTYSFEQFQMNVHYDVIINFVGVGNPAKTTALGAGIFDITSKYDDLALQYIEAHPTCKYIFLSSGAAYCSSFEEPANENTKTCLDINHIKPQDWYGVAKLHAECRHRALPHLSIVDIRVFNYFSHTQDMTARFLMTDIIRAIQSKTTLETTPHFMVRDYLHPADFYQLIQRILDAKPCNAVVDCYSQKPIDKLYLLQIMQKEFGLIYEIANADPGVIATGNKSNYFSQNKTASTQFNYEPMYGSEDAIIEQTDLFLNNLGLIVSDF